MTSYTLEEMVRQKTADLQKGHRPAMLKSIYEMLLMLLQHEADKEAERHLSSK